MTIFKTNNQKYFTQEIFSWIRSIVIVSLIYLIFYFFGKLDTEKIILGLTIGILLKIADTFTQYHVTEIKVDKRLNKFDVLLKSLMSGKKSKSYDLNEVNATIIHNIGFKRILFNQTTLKISLPNNQAFQITERYGFSKQNLKEIAELIQQTHCFDLVN